MVGMDLQPTGPESVLLEIGIIAALVVTIVLSILALRNRR